MTTAAPPLPPHAGEAVGREYRIQLDAYAGPLDLLLHLVKRHEIDLHDIPIAKLTGQYLAHLQVLELLNMDDAGEFLLMAATLLEIKSRTLVPHPDATQDAMGAGRGSDDAASEDADPRAELVQQLLAYKRFKDAAAQLEQREREWARRFPAHAVAASTPAAEGGTRSGTEGGQDGGGEGGGGQGGLRELDLEDVSVMDLCEAWGRLLDSIGASGRAGEHEITYDDTPISLHAADIYDRLCRQTGEGCAASNAANAPQPSMTLRQIFEGRRTRSEMIGLFLATLELVRERKVRVVQNASDQAPARPGEDIRLELRPQPEQTQPASDEDQPADWRDPRTGEVDYDWPSDAARRRYQRRQDHRASS